MTCFSSYPALSEAMAMVFMLSLCGERAAAELQAEGLSVPVPPAQTALHPACSDAASFSRVAERRRLQAGIILHQR